MMLYCSTATITIARGAESTRVKSASVSVIPMHSRMNCTSGEMTCFISNPPGAMNTCGNVKAAAPNASTTKVNPSPSSQRTRRDGHGETREQCNERDTNGSGHELST